VLIIRDALVEDADAIVRFWNPMIRDTAVTFASEPKTGGGVAAMIAACGETGRCFLVAEMDGEVVGFATYSQFRRDDGYAHTMESTIILAPAARGRGTARALMQRLEDHARRAGEDHARRAGVHSIIAAISGDNAQAIGFHTAIGYREAGKLSAVGHKFGRRMDLHLLQKRL